MIILPRIKFEVLDKNGNLVFSKEQLMKSFVGHWVEWQRILFGNISNYQIHDTAGTLRYIYPLVPTNVMAAINIDTYGIQIGSGSTAVALTDFALATKITHGVGAGQLSYAVQVINVFTVAGSTGYFTLVRNFNNGSGNSITVRESGLVAFCTTTSYNHLITRDLTGDIAVANTQTLIATYTFGTTV